MYNKQTIHLISANTSREDAPVVDCKHSKSHYIAKAIPEDLAPRLMRFHGNPFVWWLGQFLKYMTRPTDEFRIDMEKTKERLGFVNPIVG